jgi:2-polyprenyl-3-methyl-5-hydroxy-6-metoxy-1,4-benzoquinol methylase
MSDAIQTRLQENCPVCGQTGSILLENLRDRLFGAPGRWALHRCGSSGCRTIWINPVIVEVELHKAYANYYTHSDAPSGTQSRAAKQSLLAGSYDRFVKQQYWALRYGYGRPGSPIWKKLPGLLIYLLPNKPFYLDTHIMFLNAVSGGSVLDVGCGNGERLELLKGLGWKVRGVDFDRRAVEAAKLKGLDADCGDLPAVGYQANSFDAVISSHVLEHVPNPRQMVAECARVLKPGGRIVLVTPNADSFGLRYYGRCWRGLEPPRHLHIFSRSALDRVICDAGLSIIRSKTMLAPQVLHASHVLKTGIPMMNGAARLPRRSALFVKWLSFVESLILRINPDRGEVIISISTKF